MSELKRRFPTKHPSLATDSKYGGLNQRCTTAGKTTHEGSVNYAKSLQMPSSSSPGAIGMPGAAYTNSLTASLSQITSVQHPGHKPRV